MRRAEHEDAQVALIAELEAAGVRVVSCEESGTAHCTPLSDLGLRDGP
jgi:hypothetical protein